MFLLNPIKRPVFNPILVCDPVFLRTATLTDYTAWAALREESRAHLITWEQDWAPGDMSLASFRRRLRSYERQMNRASALPLLVYRRTDQKLLGGVTLTNIRYGAARAGMLGYWIGQPYVRKGYGAAALGAVLAHGFETIGLNRIEAACQPQNAASRALLEKCRFTREGTARDYLKINGVWRDHDLYAITAADFRKSEASCNCRRP